MLLCICSLIAPVCTLVALFIILNANCLFQNALEMKTTPHATTFLTDQTSWVPFRTLMMAVVGINRTNQIKLMKSCSACHTYSFIFLVAKKMKHKSMRLSLVQKKFQGEHTWMRFYICTHINRQSCTEGVDCSGGFVAHSHVMTDTGTVQVWRQVSCLSRITWNSSS